MMDKQTATTLFHVADHHIQSAHRIPLASQSKNQNIRTEYPEKIENTGQPQGGDAHHGRNPGAVRFSEGTDKRM